MTSWLSSSSGALAHVVGREQLQQTDTAWTPRAFMKLQGVPRPPDLLEGRVPEVQVATGGASQRRAL
eukprot:CAMPEP_0115456016 /NCGR_PEP_ID=MMETSP0271-20121206/44461_1 /TAXON_ID=71861 /ORGANISM="Scrippsiella trochoidea, Strain CCMP3099" /LENGTH=66 /DNA_ID=CAMNT_0002882499 /DNA_START=305 /DNA_END=501 /DNA_ORIENTATION=-